VPKLVNTPGETLWPGPEVGAFNDEVYRDLLDMSEQDVSELRRERII